MNGSYARRNTRRKKNDKVSAGWLVVFALLVTGMFAGTLSLFVSMAGLF